MVHKKSKGLSERLVTCSLSASIYSTYVPLDDVANQISRAVQTGDVQRLERLWLLLSDKYRTSNLAQCLSWPNPHTRKTNIMIATELKAIDLVDWFLNNGSEDAGMSKTNDGDTILHIAAACDASEIITLYHQKLQDSYDDEDAGVSLIDWRNSKGASPLCIACQKGNLDCLHTLLSHGASIDFEDNEGNTPLHYAASYGHLPIVRRLLQIGASAFTRNNLGYTASDVAFSFEVEQEIQNTVRSAFEATKRLRSAKSSAAVAKSQRSRHGSSISEDDTEIGSGAELSDMEGLPLDDLPTLRSLASPAASSSRSYALKLQTLGIQVPPLSIATSTSVTPKQFSTPTSTLLPRDLLQPSPSLDPESSKALQRILARDQNAQAGFHASAAYKGVVGPFGPVNEPATSPFSTFSKESGYFSAKQPTSMRRTGSSSTEGASESYASSSTTTGSLSPSSSPQLSLAQPPMLERVSSNSATLLASMPELPPTPLILSQPRPAFATEGVLPQSPAKSSPRSFVNRLKRSGSSSATATARPSGLISSPLDANFPPDITLNTSTGKRSLKQHASIADLRSHAALMRGSGSQPPPTPSIFIPPPPPTPQVHPAIKSAFSFAKSRARSGT